MLSLISTLGGILLGGLPKLLDYFQSKQDQKHELALARAQSERELALAAQGFAAQAKVEEIRSDQIAMQTEAAMTQGAQDHDKQVLKSASKWVANYIGTVRPTVTYLFVLELLAVNGFLAFYLWSHPELIRSIDDVVKYSELIFSSDEMAMLGGIIGFWFGSRGFKK
jgi:predicted PurR-regulated permease PerM